MTNITYVIDNTLYLNITNKCSNACTFCVANDNDTLAGYNLRFDAEPTPEEIFKALEGLDFNSYEEIVFCGFGEPTESLMMILYISAYIKEQSSTPIRLNTNGAGDLINQTDVPELLKGLIDKVSISLNAPNSLKYIDLCNPTFGEAAYIAVLNFAVNCKNSIKEVTFTVLDNLSAEEIEECRKIAEKLKVGFKVRKLA